MEHSILVTAGNKNTGDGDGSGNSGSDRHFNPSRQKCLFKRTYLNTKYLTISSVVGGKHNPL